MRNKLTPLGATLLAIAMSACGDSGSQPAGTPAAGGAAPAGAAPATAASVSTALQAEADKLLKDTGDYVKQNKWDLADKGITQLEDMKPKLPPEYGPKIDDLRKLYNTAKTAAANMPASMPTLK